MTLIGESMGAVLALTAAADLPERVRRVVAVNPYDYADGICLPVLVDLDVIKPVHGDVDVCSSAGAGTSPHYLEPLSPEEAAQVRLSDVTVRNIKLILADRYEALVVFFDAAARAGRCTVFWGPRPSHPRSLWDTGWGGRLTF